MFNFKFPDFPHTKWTDSIPGYEGNEGWYSDHLIPGTRVIYFDGTWHDNNQKAPHKGKGDIYADLSIWPAKAPWSKKGWGHSGFINYAKAGKTTLEQLGLLQTAHKLLFLGHSMGGAVVRHVAMMVHQDYPNRAIDVHTFSTPTCWGSASLCRLFEKTFPNHKSFYFANDYAQHLQWLTLIFGYKSPNSKVLIRGKSINPIEDHEPRSLAPHLSITTGGDITWLK